VPLRYLYDRLCITLIRGGKERQEFLAFGTIVSRFVAGFIAAWTSLQLLNTSKQREARPKKPVSGCLVETSDSSVRSGIQPDPNPGSAPILSYGRTIDLTLLATTRAVEAVVVNIWRRISRSHRKISSPTLSLISYYADAVVFALSSGTVMWAWFYQPSTLPHAYNKWIGEAAQVDMRLIEVLRKARAGAFIYGKDTGEQGRLLQSMCKDYDWPLRWGDPEKMIPIPCAMVHMGTGPNCHWHAAVRFVRTFQFAFATNLPLQLLVKVIARRQMSIKSVAQACREAVRSSAFLGAFVALMYYGICLSRTRLGPKLFSPATISPQMWDSGLCVRAACILCGWSILLEAEKRRQELAMFVAPRALATLLPRTYDAKVCATFLRSEMALELMVDVVFLERKDGLCAEYSHCFHHGTGGFKECERHARETSERHFMMMRVSKLGLILS